MGRVDDEELLEVARSEEIPTTRPGCYAGYDDLRIQIGSNKGGTKRVHIIRGRLKVRGLPCKRMTRRGGGSYESSFGEKWATHNNKKEK